MNDANIFGDVVPPWSDNYRFSDKLLHYLAFKSLNLQLKVAVAENHDFSGKISSVNVEKPVFITSLPRSGTSILLQILANTGKFGVQRYQDMPFICTPLTWERIKKHVNIKNTVQERLHGDGICIDSYSPESFEEMLYLAFDQYNRRAEHLELCDVLENPEFADLMTNHIKKVMLRDNKVRYLSKNNMNIRRLGLIKQVFPTAIILIPFRDPLAQAKSLLKQHLKFIKIHRKSHFSKEYMANIGHFYFGLNLKPVNYSQWIERNTYSPTTLNFWLEYWFYCYEYTQRFREQIHYVCYEALINNTTDTLKILAQRADLPESLLLAQHQTIKGNFSVHQKNDCCCSLLEKTRHLYQQICKLAL